MAEPPKVACGECGAPMRLRDSRYGLFWGCSRFPECKGTHGAHPDGRPLGVPANRATRDARIAAHDAFDAIWRGRGKRARKHAYAWLRDAMGRDKPVHIGEMTIAECEVVVRLCKQRAVEGTNA